jgi:hypothetical protein
MLPMLLSFLGAGLAKTGALGAFLGANPLMAASIGAGLGRTAETGDLGEGIKAGFGSFLGGTALGAVGGALGGGGAMATPLPNQSVVGSAVAPMTAGTPLAMPPSGISGLMPPALPPYNMAKDIFSQGMQFGSSAAGIGSAMGSTFASPQKAEGPPKSKPLDIRYTPYPRRPGTPPVGYRPGYDPEFNYFVPGYAMGGTVQRMIPGYGVVRMQEGGIANLLAAPAAEAAPTGGNEKTVIVDAIRAIKNMHPQPEIALAAFVQTYGEDALRDLVDRVQSGEFDDTVARFANGENGEVRGPGDGSGTDDMVPATIDGEQDVLLSDGEFVVRKDSTDALEDEFGDGFMDRMNNAGTRAPEAVREMVMQ